MIKTKLYQYTSSNGTATIPINLEIGRPKILYQLSAEKGKILTNGTIEVRHTIVPEEELKLWDEIDKEIEDTPVDEYEEIDYKSLLDIITGNE